MQALRQYYTVQGKTVLLHLPDNFDAKHIEVIILPSDGALETNTSLNSHIEAWRNKNDAPPPLPEWTPEQRQEMLNLLLNGPTLTEEEISEWEKDLEHARSWTPREWDND